ncbi:DUF1622 domain-containing protein [Chitinispirillales bacterium ANBcel5]|uniref:DUF1622 domain-containing protein n=1 Tax=Cellulosispirillum alkaliphilum TaxID=3039283 RepID=UPI002A54C327|nr:DUF1622 domain-containing protein [Chitinispirillales bacterium ANBcel5]
MNNISKSELIYQTIVPTVLIIGLVVLLSVGLNIPAATTVEDNSIALWIRTLIEFVANLAEFLAALVILYAVLESIISFSTKIVKFKGSNFSVQGNRLKLGRVLILGLEFTIASDVLRTILSPGGGEIIRLASIVLLRSLLNFFLEHEIRMEEQRLSPKDDTG